MMENTIKGKIFNIQKYCIHDGPGIRTTVFMKGCNLRCFWCHNPESLKLDSQLQLFLDKCFGCGSCFEVCESKAHVSTDTSRDFLRDLCVACGKCSEVCYVDALVLRGQTVTVKEVIDEVEKDRSYYETSGGGVTFSGGEPLLQKDFLLALLTECKKRGLHTAVDTAGHISGDILKEVMPYVDLWLYDLKLFDDEKHREATGVGNEIILKNIKMLAESGSNIYVRMTMVPGVNDSPEELENKAKFISELKSVKQVDILPFHKMSGGKYSSLGMNYNADELEPPSAEKLQKYAKVLKRYGINTKVM